eukprot:1159965-Pelagomonas_calceolata.AAC.14
MGAGLARDTRAPWPKPLGACSKRVQGGNTRGEHGAQCRTAHADSTSQGRGRADGGSNSGDAHGLRKKGTRCKAVHLPTGRLSCRKKCLLLNQPRMTARGWSEQLSEL